MLDGTKKDLAYATFFTSALLFAFSLGYFISSNFNLQKSPIVIEKFADSSDYTVDFENLQEGVVVASVNSDKYHYERCVGAKSIKEENKIYFESAKIAIEAGFVLAGNCN